MHCQDCKTCLSAIKNGHDACMKTFDYKKSKTAVENAAHHKQLAIYKFLIRSGCPRSFEKEIHLCAQNGWNDEFYSFFQYQESNLSVIREMTYAAPSTKATGGAPAKAKKTIKLEVKLNTAADFGQSGLKCRPNGTWYLDGQDSPEGRQMRALLTAMGVPRIVQGEWGGAGRPKIFSHPGTAASMPQRDLDYDREHFKDIMLKGSDAPQLQTLFTYYGTKDTNYIQIGQYGLYYMAADPAGLSTLGVKKFDGTLKLRIRRKPTGSRTEPWKYRFSTALLIDKKPTPSDFDLDEVPDPLYYLDPAYKVVP